MSLFLWLLPLAILGAGLPALALALRRVADEAVALRDGARSLRSLQLAVVDTRSDIEVVRAQYRRLRSPGR